MKYRYLGRSGLLVSRICLGTMTFGNNEWGCDLDTSRSIVKAFIEGGGNFIDTADAYSAGESERILADIMKDHKRDDLVIATKGFFPQGDAVTQRGLSRKHIVEACEQSLKRLDIDYIDLYQFHGPDPFTPIEESLRAADDLISCRQGALHRLLELLWLADLAGQRHRRTQGLREAGLGAAPLQSRAPRHRARDPAGLRGRGRRHDLLEPAGGGHAQSGKYRGQNRPAEGTRHGHQSGDRREPLLVRRRRCKIVDAVAERRRAHRQDAEPGGAELAVRRCRGSRRRSSGRGVSSS